MSKWSAELAACRESLKKANAEIEYLKKTHEDTVRALTTKNSNEVKELN